MCKRFSIWKKWGYKYVNWMVRSEFLWFKVIDVVFVFLKSWKMEKNGMMLCFLVGIVLIFYIGCKCGFFEF